MYISSVNNSKVKQWSKLIRQKKMRDEMNSYIVEGYHLVEEALQAGLVEQLIVSEDEHHQFDFETVYTVSDAVMKKISDMVSPQGVLAVCRQNNSVPSSSNRLLLLDGIQDPGNLGTIIRTADAFKFDGIVMSEDTVDLYNPKVIRSTQGSLFRVPVLKANLFDYINKLKARNILVYGTCLNGRPLSELNTSSEHNVAILLGNEGNGVRDDYLQLTDENLFIEMSGESESLNVAVAAAIFMYHFKI
ncbi:TrmH family RNA methyltransferase [Haloplasma contractile]|nr:RNA methyltransferase [Haloplasma contractile]